MAHQSLDAGTSFRELEAITGAAVHDLDEEHL